MPVKIFVEKEMEGAVRSRATHPHTGLLRTTEKELQIFRTQAIHCDLVVIDRSGNHGCLLLLQRDHTRLHAILDTEAGDDTRALLSNAVATVGGLPLGGRIPPSGLC